MLKDREKETQRELDFEPNINHIDERMEEAWKERKTARERQSDRELFDEFIRVRSWVAWSQGLLLWKSLKGQY